jgi:hypothetical protein
MFNPLFPRSPATAGLASRPAGDAGVWIALGVLSAGALVYLTDRPADAVPFFEIANVADRVPNLFGRLGQYLPNFAHAFAFSLWTAALFGYRRAATTAACLGWCLIDLAFELGQHAAVGPYLSDRTPEIFERIPGLAHADNYFASGTYDLADVTSIMAGAAGAYLAARWLGKRNCSHAHNSA